MNKFFLIVLLFFSFSNISFAQTQSEINLNSFAAYQKADKEINTVFQRILKEYSKDPEFIKNLKASQRLWIQFRDAELLARFPKRSEGYYGSMQPTCEAEFLTELTKERIKALRVWINGFDGEGDACAGSVKMNGPR